MPNWCGKIEGFYGWLRGEKYIERPFGMANFLERRCPTELPYWAPSGWRLVALVPPERTGGCGPYAIYDAWGNMLHLWNQEYPPSYVEVMEVCTRLLNKAR